MSKGDHSVKTWSFTTREIFAKRTTLNFNKRFCNQQIPRGFLSLTLGRLVLSFSVFPNFFINVVQGVGAEFNFTVNIT